MTSLRSWQYNPHPEEPIVECIVHEKDEPSISLIAGRRFINLHAWHDTWVYPWKYTTIELNIEQLYIPEGCIGIVASQRTAYLSNPIEVKTDVITSEAEYFPNGIQVKCRKGVLPHKIHAGEMIAALHIVSLKEIYIKVGRNSEFPHRF